MEAKIKKLFLRKSDPKAQEIVMLEEEGMQEQEIFSSLDESIVDERAPKIKVKKPSFIKLPTLHFD